MESRALYGLDKVEIRPECLVSIANGWTPPLGLEIRAALKMAGTNAEEFSRRIGVDGRTVRRWVLEEKPMPFAPWYVLAKNAGQCPQW